MVEEFLEKAGHANRRVEKATLPVNHHIIFPALLPPMDEWLVRCQNAVMVATERSGILAMSSARFTTVLCPSAGKFAADVSFRWICPASDGRIRVRMKSIFTIAVILALGFIGYIAYPAGVDFLRTQNLLPAETKPAAVPGVQAAPPAAPPTPAPAAPVSPAPVPEVAPVAPKPVPANDSVDQLVPMPAIKSLEEITSNWTNVPERAFPQKVTLKADVSFALPQGNALSLSAGREVTPVSLAADGTLTVAPRAGSNLRATLPLAQTDFKELVTARYDEGVARIKQGVQTRREKERARLAAAATTSDDEKATAGEVPKSASDEERYLALMKESVASGELQGVTPDKVKSWRWLGYEDVGGTGYWTGAAIIIKETYFGEFETEAKAYIRQGKVEKWTLPGVQE